MDTVQIIHPQTGAVAEVPASSLRFHFRAGWRRLAEGEEPAVATEPEPEPMTRAQAAEAAASQQTAATESEDE